MLNQYNHFSCILNIYIDDSFVDFDFPTHERLVRQIWDSIPIEKVQYLALLDQHIYENRFHVAPGRAAVGKLIECGLERVGDLIPLTLDEIAARSGLDERQLYRLAHEVKKMGLHFASDVTLWREYRATVPPEFRLSVPYGRRLPHDTASAREI